MLDKSVAPLCTSGLLPSIRQLHTFGEADTFAHSSVLIDHSCFYGLARDDRIGFILVGKADTFSGLFALNTQLCYPL